MESTFQTGASFHITTPSTTSLVAGDRKPERRSRSPSHSSSSQALRPDEDWTKISDLAERRRIQNRIAQRNYRKKLKRRLEELEKRAGGSPPSDSNSPPPLQTSPDLSTESLPESEDGHLSMHEVSRESMVDPILVQSSYPPFTYSQPSKPSESSLDVFQTEGSHIPRQQLSSQGVCLPKAGGVNGAMKSNGYCEQSWSPYCMGWGMLGQDNNYTTLPDGSIPLNEYHDPTILISDGSNQPILPQMDGSLDGSFYSTALSSPSLSQDMAPQFVDVYSSPAMRDWLLHLMATGQVAEEDMYREYGAKLQQQPSNSGSISSAGQLSDDDAEGILDVDAFVKPEHVDGDMLQWQNFWQENRGGREAVLLQ